MSTSLGCRGSYGAFWGCILENEAVLKRRRGFAPLLAANPSKKPKGNLQ